MPRNGSGVFSPPSANYPAVSGTLIESADRNAIDSDIATAITNSIAVNGESVVTNNIPFGGNKLTGVGAATARTDAMTLANAQDGTGVYVATVGGTADVITISPNPSVPAYVAGQMFSFIASGANTTNVTINVSGLGAKAITKNGATALVAGDIPSGFLVSVRYDGTRFQLIGGKDSFNGGTVTNPVLVPDDAYAVGWNGSAQVPTKNAVYDKIESILDGQTFTGDIIVPDEAYDATAWNGNLEVPTKNAVRDKIETLTGIVGCRGYFESAQQTITSGGSLTIAHGLAGKPVKFESILVCTTAEAGFSIGNEQPCNTGIDDNGGNGRGFAMVADATNLNVRFSSSANAFTVNNFTTGTATLITNANWRLVIRAWY